MIDELQLLGKMILNQKHDLAKRIQTNRFSEIEITETQRRELQQFEPLLLEIRANFVGLFGEALINHKDKDQLDHMIREWGKTNGNYFFELGTPLHEALKDTSFYRDYLWETIKNDVKENNYSLETVFETISIIDPLLDKAAYYFSLAFTEAFQKSLKNAQLALLEMSVPVVSLEPGVGILPLIGIIDTARAQLLMEETLKQAEKLKLSYLVLDMSGVITVDTSVADQIFKVIAALSLIGVKTIITGIRPDVAQTVVSLGISTNHLTIKKDPFHALEHIRGLNL